MTQQEQQNQDQTQSPEIVQKKANPNSQYKSKQGAKEPIQAKWNGKPLAPIQARRGQVIQRKTTDNPQYTTRLVPHGQTTQFALKNADGTVQQFDKNENHQGNIVLPAGIKVAKLEASSSDPTLIKVIVWYQGQHREGYVDRVAFDSTKSAFENNPHAVEVFIQDAEHAIARARSRMQFTLKDIEGNIKKYPQFADTYQKQKQTFLENNAQFITLVAGLTRDIEACKSGKIQLTPEMLKTLDQEHVQSMGKGQNKVERLQNAEEAVHGAYNPKAPDKKAHADTTFLIPLSKEWFYSHPQLQMRYESKWASHGALNRLGGGSGEGTSLKDEIQHILAELMELRSLVAGLPIMESPEAQWLANLQSSHFSSVRRVIFMHEKAWNYGANDQYAEYVALDESFGPLRPDPLMTILIHEMNVNTDDLAFTPSDTHLSPGDTKSAREEVNTSGLDKMKASNPDKVDNLFQSESYVSVITLAHFMNKIKQKQ